MKFDTVRPRKPTRDNDCRPVSLRKDAPTQFVDLIREFLGDRVNPHDKYDHPESGRFVALMFERQ